MDAGDWIALGGTIFALVLHSIAVAMFLARLAAKVDGNTKAIDLLVSGKVSMEQGTGFQAQLNRLEKGAAECEGRINQMRVEFEGRQERLTSRLNTHEQATNAQTAQLTNALTRLDETMKGMKQSVDQLSDAERARMAAPQAPAHNQPDLMQLLQLAVQAAPLVQQLVGRERAHA
jgi:hypothetical protein